MYVLPFLPISWQKWRNIQKMLWEKKKKLDKKDNYCHCPEKKKISKTSVFPELSSDNPFFLKTFFDSFLCFADMRLMSKWIHDLAPPPRKQCVSFCRDNARETRASVTGDCLANLRKTAFWQSAFSARAAEKMELNSHPYQRMHKLPYF